MCYFTTEIMAYACLPFSLSGAIVYKARGTIDVFTAATCDEKNVA